MHLAILRTFLTSAWLLALLFVPIDMAAQQIQQDHLEALKIRNIGPAGMSGRVTCIDVDLSEPERIYIGTASGGVWLSENGGVQWEPIFDDQPMQSIGAVAINQNNPSEIWVGAGEGNPRNSHNAGNGIYKSLNGGRSWKHLGLENTKLIHRIIVHRDDPNTVYVGALGSAWGPNAERGVFKTTDGGKSWRKVLYVNEETGCADLVVNPQNPNMLIAAMWEFGRKPWTFNSGGPGSGLYISFDGGETWEERTEKDGLPKGPLGRIGLSFAPSKPKIVYALVEAQKNGLYKSSDGGFSWKLVADKNIGNRPFYYADIFVDTKNENRIYNLHSIVTISQDGGKSFETLLPYGGSRSVHPDHHAFWQHPENPGYMIEGNDGGLYISRDGGDTWRMVENLPLGQFYHINYDMEVPYNVMGGLQDNGSWVGPSAIWQSGGIRNHEWQEVLFGDGFDVVMQPDNPRYGYAMSQGGNISRFDKETGQRWSIRPVHPEGKDLRFNWNAALAQNPFHNCGIYYGSQYLHKSLDCGNSWEIISPDLTTNDTTRQKQHESGGLTIDDTNAENFTTIVAIAPSPVEEDVIWVGTDDGNLQLTLDGGQTWTNLADRLPDCPAGSWIPQIEPATTNAGEAFIVVNNYRRNDWRPMVYHTTDFGATFKRIVNESQAEGHALSIVQDPEVSALLWLGTDYGLYYSVNGGSNWQKWTNDYPSVSTRDLKIHPREGDLIIGTFGRAAWILDDIRPLREIARTEGQVLEKPFAVFPAPDAYLSTYRSVDAGRFVANGEFIGANKRSGAMLTLWVKPPANEKPTSTDKKGKKAKVKESEAAAPKKRKQEKKEVIVRILDSSGDTIRTYATELDTGMNRIYWNLSSDGVEFPSRRERRDKYLPSGMQVRPGMYKIFFAYGEEMDSTKVKVHPDPRIDHSQTDWDAMKARYEDFTQIVEKATLGFKRLQECEKVIGIVEQQLINAPDSVSKDMKERGKVIGDSLKQLVELYLSPQNQKGIRRNQDNLRSSFWRAYSYLNDSQGSEPSQMAGLALEIARQRTAETLEKINRFLEEDWKAYREAAEAIDYPLFKDYEALKME